MRDICRRRARIRELSCFNLTMAMEDAFFNGTPTEKNVLHLRSCASYKFQSLNHLARRASRLAIHAVCFLPTTKEQTRWSALLVHVSVFTLGGLNPASTIVPYSSVMFHGWAAHRGTIKKTLNCSPDHKRTASFLTLITHDWDKVAFLQLLYWSYPPLWLILVKRRRAPSFL